MANENPLLFSLEYPEEHVAGLEAAPKVNEKSLSFPLEGTVWILIILLVMASIFNEVFAGSFLLFIVIDDIWRFGIDDIWRFGFVFLI
ncbi:MAG: hypothetical protein HFH66_10170 [Lachnospiraceae bacterium]|nr:hypothetical protein [Lachnospiraceae bacterium]